MSKKTSFLGGDLNRRNFMRNAAAISATGMLPGAVKAFAADGATPHFFLHLTFSHALDCSYFFDARDAKLTEKNLKVNYFIKNDNTSLVINDEEKKRLSVLTSDPGTSHNGKCLRTSITDPLMPYFRDTFSVINGVFMSFDQSHPNNYHQLYGGSTTSRASFVPYIGQKSGRPLEGVHIAGCSPFNEDGATPPNNFSGSLVLRYDSGAQLGADIKNNLKPVSGSLPYDSMMRSYGNFSSINTLFGTGNRKMVDAMKAAVPLYDSFSSMAGTGGSSYQCNSSPDFVEIEQILPTVSNFFRAGITSAITVNYFDISFFDMHGVSQAQNSVAIYTTVARQMQKLMEFMNTEYANGLKWKDVTTFLISTEFNRTMVQDFSFDGNAINAGASGTDHNPLTNSMLVGGKGIQSGLVIGASDLDVIDDAGKFQNVSGAHLEGEKRLDFSQEAKLNKMMAKPFDFTNSTVAENALPESFHHEDYITVNNVSNTLMSLYGIDEQVKLAPQSPLTSAAIKAPVIKKLLKV